MIARKRLAAWSALMTVGSLVGGSMYQAYSDPKMFVAPSARSELQVQPVRLVVASREADNALKPSAAPRMDVVASLKPVSQRKPAAPLVRVVAGVPLMRPATTPYSETSHISRLAVNNVLWPYITNEANLKNLCSLDWQERVITMANHVSAQTGMKILISEHPLQAARDAGGAMAVLALRADQLACRGIASAPRVVRASTGLRPPAAAVTANTSVDIIKTSLDSRAVARSAPVVRPKPVRVTAKKVSKPRSTRRFMASRCDPWGAGNGLGNFNPACR